MMGNRRAVLLRAEVVEVEAEAEDDELDEPGRWPKAGNEWQ